MTHKSKFASWPRTFWAQFSVENAPVVHGAFFVTFAFVALAWWLTLSTYHLHDADSLDYAQMGHQLATGQGFTTLQVFPRHIPWLASRGLLGTVSPPNLYRYPLTPLANAAFELLTRNSERAAIVQAGVWLLATIPVLYLLALELSSAPIALLCALLFVLQTSSWTTSHDGLTESLAALLTTVVIYLVVRGMNSYRSAILVGVACGLAYLCRTQLLVLLPWSLLVSALRFGKSLKISVIVALLVGMSLTVAPWMVRNLAIAGSPAFSFSNTRNFAFYVIPNTDIELDMNAPVTLAAVFHNYGAAIAAKIGRNLWPNIINPLAVTSSYVPALLLVALATAVPLAWREKIHGNRIGITFAGIVIFVLLNFAASTALRIDPRYYVAANPALIAAGVPALLVIAKNLIGEPLPDSAKLVATWLMIGICVAMFVDKLDHRYGYSEPTPEDAVSYGLLAKLTNARDVVASDESYKVAFFAGRLSVRLPSEPEQLSGITRRYLPIDYVVMSRGLVDGDPTAEQVSLGYGRYYQYRKSAEFVTAYKLIRSLPNGAEVYKRNRGDQRKQGIEYGNRR